MTAGDSPSSNTTSASLVDEDPPVGDSYESSDSNYSAEADHDTDEELDSEFESESDMSTTTTGANPAGATAPATTTTTALTVGSIILNKTATKHVLSDIVKPLYKKEDRQKLTDDKKNDLFEKITKTRFTKFDLVTLTLSNEDKLDDTYNLGIQVGKLRSHFVKFDLHDVFTVLKFSTTDPDTPIDTADLFTNYSSLSEDEVAKSNRWYTLWATEDYYRENLQLTFDFLENNSTESLWEKCLELYDEHETESRGGPLLFIIMMKKLQSDTDTAVQYLVNSIKNLKLTNYEGENVSRVASLIRGAHKRLKGVGQNKVPEDFPKWVLAIFQTSTVPEFNTAFSHLQREIEVVSCIRSTPQPYPTVDNILKIAEKLYLEMTSTDTWTGIKTKANQSVFPSIGDTPPKTNKKVTCWNCGSEGHSVNECTKPKNNAVIERRKEVFKEERKKLKKGKTQQRNNNNNGNNNNKSSPSGKYAPPTDAENNRRVIDGKKMYFLHKTKRWVPDRKSGDAAPSSTQMVHPALPGVPQAPPLSTPSPSGMVGRELALTNATHSINLAMQGLANAMKSI